MHSFSTVFAALRLSAFAIIAAAGLLGGAAVAVAQDTKDTSKASEQQDVELEVLIEAIEDFGRWRKHEQYGDVWTPNVDKSWRPYTLGQWAYNEENGWTWVSDEPFGWVVYHYGRWSFDDEFGWFWVPGTRWAPAWVAWREADEHIGWAPLPPDPPDYDGPLYERTIIYDEPRFEPWWVFASYAVFAEPHIHRHLFHRHRHEHRWHDIYRRSRPGHFARWRHRRMVNRGVSLRELRRRARRHVRPAHAVISNRDRARRAHRRAGRGLVQVYRPARHAKPRRAIRHNAKRRFHNTDVRRVNRKARASREARRPAKAARFIRQGRPHLGKGPPRRAARAINRKSSGAHTRRAIRRQAHRSQRASRPRANVRRQAARRKVHRPRAARPRAARRAAARSNRAAARPRARGGPRAAKRGRGRGPRRR